MNITQTQQWLLLLVMNTFHKFWKQLIKPISPIKCWWFDYRYDIPFVWEGSASDLIGNQEYLRIFFLAEQVLFQFKRRILRLIYNVERCRLYSPSRPGHGRQRTRNKGVLYNAFRFRLVKRLTMSVVQFWSSSWKHRLAYTLLAHRNILISHSVDQNT